MNYPTQNKHPSPRTPLPQPGESLRKTIDTLIEDRVELYAFIPAGFLLIALIAWCDYIFDVPRKTAAWTTTVLLLLVAPYCAYKLVRLRQQLRKLHRGYDGERQVADYIKQHIEPLGYTAFHDLVEASDAGGNFNIDHVLLGPGGIFVLETKNPTPPSDEDAFVRYDGCRIQLPNQNWRSDELRQVNACADRVRDILLQRTSRRDWPIRAVLTYPLHWQIERSSSGKDTWVLNPYGLRRFLEHEPAVLSPNDLIALRNALTDHIKSTPQATSA